MTEQSLFPLDLSHPRQGASVKSQVLTDQLTSLATDSAGSASPITQAKLFGDKQFSKVDLSVRNKVSITIDLQQQLNIDLSSLAADVQAVTPQEVVDAINSAFSGIFPGVSEVAYTFSSNADESSAYVLIEAPGTPASTQWDKITGGSTITVDRGTTGQDALDEVFGFGGRGVSIPLTVTGVALPKGYRWYRTEDSGGEEVRRFINTPAAAVGLTNHQGNTLNLSTNKNLRIEITTNSITYGPLDIDVSTGGGLGSTAGSRQLADIVEVINTAFIGEPSWPLGGGGAGPATIVSKGGSGSYIKIVSGNSDDPGTGDSEQVVLSPSTSLVFLLDDAITEVFGLQRGEGDRLYDRLPYTFSGTSFTTNYVRGLEDRSGAGIGPWGRAVESAEDLPTAGVVDGEVRIAKNSGLPWVYRTARQGQLNPVSSWKRAIPAVVYPLQLDRVYDRFELRTTEELWIPEGLEDPNNTARFLSTSGHDIAITTVEARDSVWPRVVTANPGSGEITTTPSFFLHRSANRYDYLDDRTTTLTPSTELSQWTSTGGASAFGIDPGGAGAVTTGTGERDSVFYHSPPGYTHDEFQIEGTGPFPDFTIPYTSGNSVLQGGFHAILVNQAGTVIETPLTECWDDGTVGPSVSLVGPNISAGSLDRSSGVISGLQFSSTVPADSRLRCRYATGTEIIVCAQVRKDTSAQSATAEVGLIYGASHTNAGAIDTTSGYLVVVRDDGTGEILEYRGDSGVPIPTTFVGSSGQNSVFVIDPPLDDQWRTLRVRLTRGGGQDAHTVYWNGSEKASAWFGRELEFSDSPGSANFLDNSRERTELGEEVQRSLAAVYTIVPTNNPTPNVFTGFTGVAQTNKNVWVRHFQTLGGSADNFELIPAVPPVSGHRLRDSIHAITAKDTSSTYITHSDVANPVTFSTATTGMTSTVSSRTVSYDYDVLEALKPTVLNTAPLFWRSSGNTEAPLAYYILHQQPEGSSALGIRPGLELDNSELPGFGNVQGRYWPNGGFATPNNYFRLDETFSFTGLISGSSPVPNAWGEIPIDDAPTSRWKMSVSFDIIAWEHDGTLTPTGLQVPGIDVYSFQGSGSHTALSFRIASSYTLRPKVMNMEVLAYRVGTT